MTLKVVSLPESSVFRFLRNLNRADLLINWFGRKRQDAD